MANCFVQLKTGKEPAVLMGIFQESIVVPPSPMVGGHTGGVVAHPVAVIRMKDNTLKKVHVNQITMADEPPACFRDKTNGLYQ